MASLEGLKRLRTVARRSGQIGTALALLSVLSFLLVVHEQAAYHQAGPPYPPLPWLLRQGFLIYMLQELGLWAGILLVLFGAALRVLAWVIEGFLKPD